MVGDDAALAQTAETYRHWALVESHGLSPIYERLALAVAERPGVLGLLQHVERPRRQPNLLLGALRWHGVDVGDPASALTWVEGHRDLVLDVLRTRRTQTNEAARCALLLPALARLARRSPGPLAIVEVGASAGLCLLYDAWRYRYEVDDVVGAGAVHEVGPADSPVTLGCAVTGPAPLPAAVPTITWRAGIDLHPVDPSDPDARRWLQALVWPEHVERAGRLVAALEVAAAAGPDVRAGDMVTDLAALLEEARTSAEVLAPDAGPATVVVTHTSSMIYLDPEGRDRVRRTITDAGAHRLGGEHEGVLPDVDARVPEASDVGGQLVVSLDDVPLALAHPHGAALHWL